MTPPTATPTTTRLTAAQQRTVFTNDTNLLVGAGAGSGKTTTVVQKLCYLLGAPMTDSAGWERRIGAPLAMSEIAAITYTNQAAADLKRKLRGALARAGLRDAAAETDAARIGTIHSFCGDILREFALRAGLPPAYRVLTEGEALALAGEAARRALHRTAERGMMAELGALVAGRRLSDVLSCIVRIARDANRLATWEANGELLRPHERTLLLLARDAADLHTAELERRGALDFDRMITATRDLLRDDMSVRRAVQRELRVLVVDEFQDVDPAQRDMVMLLAGHADDDPTPTRIVLVGDPKQSIYRFRGADVSLWSDVARQFQQEGLGARVELADNFRSKRGILTMVDSLIGTRLDRPAHQDGARRAFEVDYAPLVASGANCDGDECVELLLVPSSDSGKPRPVGEVRGLEAAAIAARVAELAAAGTPYGDIALLLTSWSDAETYEEAMRSLGIPTYALRASGFWETREVVDCVLALRAIRDRGDDVALVGFLKGPLVGVRDETLLAMAVARDARGLAGALRTEPRERELLDRAIEQLDRFSALRDRMPVHELLQRLLFDTGFLAYLALDAERGLQAIANVRKLLRLAARTADISLGEFLRSVAETRERGDKEGEERLFRERADAVTITSVHSAKGLEWPVVFWCDLVREARVESEALLCGRELFRLREVDVLDADGEPVDDVRHTELREELRLEALAESYRLWYVASTRPQRLLVLSGVPLGAMLKPPRSVAGLIREHFGEELLAEPTPHAIRYAGASGEGFNLVIRTAATLPQAAIPS
jgi:ATP-dependent exoDNAse (exonuclease V) beta subunit